ncbi:MAG: YihY/virulence factor BrkB family protein [Chloroflexi bacterium]|uniref:YihY/virulence factor BrkB family protein n=1 Tax=Candidatus Chlorohelix allophototropha TaxID=3003348 RepID=A0A8T7M1N0_9CHLR|nr:YihY/virulence factor BrkB family protein [Chloroflexota bacterium]WJW66564.1 YihY/virulence factor BrkB family protein [Chloroflexota bacterium L227-S17]
MKGIFSTLKRGLTKFLEDQGTGWAAAIAYYALVSVFPLIIGVVVIATLIIQDDNTRKDITKSLIEAFPKADQAGVNINEIINNFIDTLSKAAPVLAVVSVIGTLWSGSGVLDGIMTAVNVAWDVKRDRRSFFKKAVIRFGMLIGLGILFIISTGMGFAIQIIRGLDIGILGISTNSFSLLWDTIIFIVLYLLNVAIFMVIYRLAPDRTLEKRIRWKPILLGAVIAAFLFEISKLLLTFFLTGFGGAQSYQRTYGAIAGVIIFLFYVYVSACILLIGAEIAAVATRKAEVEAGELREPEIKKTNSNILTPVTVEIAKPKETKSGLLPAFFSLAIVGLFIVAGRKRSNRK